MDAKYRTIRLEMAMTIIGAIALMPLAYFAIVVWAVVLEAL